jgi:hypothetical protein
LDFDNKTFLQFTADTDICFNDGEINHEILSTPYNISMYAERNAIKVSNKNVRKLFCVYTLFLEDIL